MLFQRLTWAQGAVLPLWPVRKIPNYQKTQEVEKREVDKIIKLSLVQTPTSAVYLPTKQSVTGQADIICPGGGYRFLSYNLEGSDSAYWLVSKGIAAIVLKSRLPNSKSNVVRHLSPLLDAQQAIRLVRANATKWGITKDKVGIMGFSTGGHLASILATHFAEGDKQARNSVEVQSCRPDFATPVYPVISMSKSITRGGSRLNLLSEHANSTLTCFYSSKLQVISRTPPTFLVHAQDDKIVPMENSLEFSTINMLI